MSTHTPGPWTVLTIDSDDCFEVGGPTQTDGLTGGYRWFGKADAHLIAAAPEMLAALQEVVVALNGRVHSYPALRALYNAERAIAKAEGRS